MTGASLNPLAAKLQKAADTVRSSTLTPQGALGTGGTAMSLSVSAGSGHRLLHATEAAHTQPGWKARANLTSNVR